jgi:hypothetical protein
MKEIKSIEAVYHYSEEDEDCSGDYYDIELKVNGKIVLKLGDYYDCKSEYVIDGFIEGLKFCGIKMPKLKTTHIADRPY